MKRVLPFMIICISVVVFAAVGPMVGDSSEQAGLFQDASPVAVERLN